MHLHNSTFRAVPAFTNTWHVKDEITKAYHQDVDRARVCLEELFQLGWTEEMAKGYIQAQHGETFKGQWDEFVKTNYIHFRYNTAKAIQNIPPQQKQTWAEFHQSQTEAKAVTSAEDFGDENHAAWMKEGTPRRRVNLDAIVDVLCGQLPQGTVLQYFLAPTQKINDRNLETLYWQKFGEQMAVVNINHSVSFTPQSAVDRSWHIDSGEALRAAEQQKKLFKAIDSFAIDTLNGADTTSSTFTKAADPYDRDITVAMAKIPQTYTWTPTIVMEAAFHLLTEGLLNIPDVGCINVKQARAFLWNAAWLQEFENDRREEECAAAEYRQVKKASKSIEVDGFHLAIIGAGGTGKTAVMKLTEALITYFAGADTVKKLAPSNAAARLLGGDTIHSLCKLPFGNAQLTSKKGRLTKGKLCAHRRIWRTTIAAFVDEVSMISADQFHHCDVRMRQAKQNPERQFGGLALNICGDFLQLPPVDKDNSRRSLAMPYEE